MKQNKVSIAEHRRGAEAEAEVKGSDEAKASEYGAGEREEKREKGKEPERLFEARKFFSLSHSC